MKTRSLFAAILAISLGGNCLLTQSALAEPPTIAAQTDSKERLEAAQMGSNYGYVDPHGKLAIDARYQNAFDFFEGLAAVKLNDKWGYIDRTGKLVIPHEFDDAVSFAGGLAAVKIDDKWGYIDRNGELAIGITFNRPVRKLIASSEHSVAAILSIFVISNERTKPSQLQAITVTN